MLKVIPLLGLFAAVSLLGSAYANEPTLGELLRSARAAAQAQLAAQRQAHLVENRQQLADWQAVTSEIQADKAALLAAQAQLAELQEAAAQQQRAQGGREREVALRRQRLLAVFPADLTSHFEGGAAAFAHLPDAVALASEQVLTTAAVRLQAADVFDRTGKPVQRSVLSIGAWQHLARGATPSEYALLQQDEFGQGDVVQAQSGRSPVRQVGRLVGPHVGEPPALVLPTGWQLIPIDVTGALATQAPDTGWSVARFIAAGGVFLWPLFGIAALGLVLIAERLVTLLTLRAPRSLATSVLAAVQAGEMTAAQDAVRQGTTPLARVLQAGLEAWRRGKDAVEAALQGALVQEELRLGRSLRLLAVLAAAAPLLGLLGTVSGMIGTFDVIAVAGTGNPQLLSGGISEALVTTLTGLIVAVPLLLAHALLTRLVERRYARLEQAATLLHGAHSSPLSESEKSNTPEVVA